LADAERSFGPESSNAVLSLVSLAGAEAKRGRPEEAETLFRRALATSRKTGERLDLIQVAKEYARFLRERGREEEARQVEAMRRPGASAVPPLGPSGSPR
jgi:Tfp pilus assembly protein PilF